MTSNLGEKLAIRAFEHIARDDKLCMDFIESTGLNPADLKSYSTDSSFLRAGITFLLQYETECAVLAANIGLSASEFSNAVQSILENK